MAARRTAPAAARAGSPARSRARPARSPRTRPARGRATRVRPIHGRAKSGSTAWPSASTIVVSSTRKPQKISACISPGSAPLEELALAEDLGRLPGRARRQVAGAVDRAAQPHDPGEEARPSREQAARGGEQEHQHDGPDDHRGECRPAAPAHRRAREGPTGTPGKRRPRMHDPARACQCRSCQ